MEPSQPQPISFLFFCWYGRSLYVEIILLLTLTDVPVTHSALTSQEF